MTLGRKEKLLNQQELEERLTYWQNRLRLNHWTITVSTCQYDTIEAEGQNNYNTQLLESEILLVHPTQHNAPGDYDMEFLLIHELLHLVIEVNRHSTTYKNHQVRDLEVAINSMTRTLLSFEDEKEETPNGQTGHDGETPLRLESRPVQPEGRFETWHGGVRKTETFD